MDEIVKSLEGCDVLYSIYWIRFAIGGDNHNRAVERVSRLFEIVRSVGVKRIVFFLYI